MILAGLRRLGARLAAAADSDALVGVQAASSADPVRRAAGGAEGEDRTRRRTVVVASVTISILAVAWVATYLVLGRPLAAAIPLAYQVATIAGLVAVARGRSFRAFRTSQIAMMTFLPFVLQWILGGFAASSAVSLWALVAALGAVFFLGAARAVPWFVAFGALTAVSTLVDPLLASTSRPVPAIVTTLFFALNVLGVSTTAFLIVQYFVRRREAAIQALDAEHARSERLLLNILPAAIAERLKTAGGIIADAHPEVSVLFADIVGFTAYAAETTPEIVVQELDRLFSTFDELVDRAGLEKVKTIGDAYMVVGGAPVPRPDHAAAVVTLGWEMLQATERAAAEPGGSRFRIRIGVDTGPVVAGVIGRRKFSYDLWGDPVNTAARMESHGEPGRMQVTAAVELRLRDRFIFEPRAETEVKGKGRMRTYFLVGPR